MLDLRGVRGGSRVDVVLARDADDADVTEAFAAALLTSGAVRLSGTEVGPPCCVPASRGQNRCCSSLPSFASTMVLDWQGNGRYHAV